MPPATPALIAAWDLPDFPVFRADGQSVGPADVLQWAFGHAASDRVDSVCRRLTAMAAVRERDEAPPDDALDLAFEAFREERQLFTADETEAWLERWKLSLDDVSDCLERDYWERVRPDANEGPHPTEVEFRAAFWPEAVCSRAFDAWTVGLARRMAARRVLAGRPPVADRDAARALLGSGCRFPMPCSAAFTAFAAAGATAAAVELEATYIALCRQALTEERVARVCAAQRQDLMLVDLAEADFATLPAAREAALCIGEDGETAEAVVARAGVSVRRRRIFLAELPEALRTGCAAAGAGAVFGPLPSEGRFRIFVMENRLLPEPGVPAIRARAEALALNAYFESILPDIVEALVLTAPAP